MKTATRRKGTFTSAVKYHPTDRLAGRVGRRKKWRDSAFTLSRGNPSKIPVEIRARSGERGHRGEILSVETRRPGTRFAAARSLASNNCPGMPQKAREAFRASTAVEQMRAPSADNYFASILDETRPYSLSNWTSSSFF